MVSKFPLSAQEVRGEYVLHAAFPNPFKSHHDHSG